MWVRNKQTRLIWEVTGELAEKLSRSPDFEVIEEWQEAIQVQVQNKNSNVQHVESRYGTTQVKDETEMYIAQLSAETKDIKRKRHTTKEK